MKRACSTNGTRFRQEAPKVALAAALVLCSVHAQAFLKGVTSSTYGSSDMGKIFNLNAAWTYNWGATEPASPGTGSMEYVPMAWSGASVNTANVNAWTAGAASGQYKELLGFNEPDQSGQANMTPAQAIRYWPQLQSTGLALGSPACSSPFATGNTGNGTNWLQDFMALAQANGYRVDFICFHAYIDWSGGASSAATIQNWCQQVYSWFGKPIWITEIGTCESSAYAPNSLAADMFMQGVFQMVGGLSYVQRVAWFADNSLANGGCADTSLYDANNNLTSLGQIWRDNPVQPVPGRVQAEDYANYSNPNDTTGNPGGAYRGDNVGVEATQDAPSTPGGKGWDVGYLNNGEWLEYPIQVASAGSYDFSFRVASGATAGPQGLQMLLDGVNFGPAVVVPNTGGWQNWTTVVVPGLSLPAGQHTLRLVFTVTGTNGAFNLDYFDVSPHQAVPGIVQADNFAGYFDTTAGNQGAVYGGTWRENDPDLQPCTDGGTGYSVGWTAPGEWLAYPIQVPWTNPYNFNIRVANGSGTAASVQMLLDGTNFGPVVSVPPTGGWANWVTESVAGLTLTAGTHSLGLSFTAGGCNFNYIGLAAQGTPTSTPSPTPYAGTPTSTPSATPSPTATVTPAVNAHGPLVADFENNTDNAVTYWNGGAVLTKVDAYGSSLTPNPWTAGSATAGGAYGASAYSACLSGTLVQSVGTNYPYADLVLELIPGGSGVGGPAVDVTPYCPNRALTFDYRAGMAGVTYTVSLITPGVSDYGYYQYSFCPSDTNWHTLSVYFPGSPNSPQFFQPACFAAVPFNETQIGAVQFSVAPSTTASVPFSLCLDNVTFGGGSSAPPPPHTGLVTDFESNTNNGQTYWNYGRVLTAKDCFGSTLNPYPWMSGSGSAPGNGGGFCGRINGVLAQSVGTNYPFCQLSLELVPGGSGYAGPSTDVTPYSPGRELTFDYASAAPGTGYTVTLITPYVTDYGYYQYSFTPADTAWHTLTVYFPGAGTPAFAQPAWAAAQTFDATRVGAVNFSVNSSTTGTVPYDLRVDNVSFGGGYPPSATPTPSPTPSATGTATASPSGTPTASPTASPSPTPSATGTATASPSGTPTDSPSGTISPSFTASPVVSATPSPSISPTFSASPSFTVSPTATATASPSGTATASPTASASWTPSATASPTGTASQSPTASPSPSRTASFSATPTDSASATPSLSPSASASVTPTQTAPPSPTASPSATASPSPGPTPSVTPSPTAGPPAAPAGQGGGRVVGLVPVPNPQPGPWLGVDVLLSAPAGAITLQIYDKALVLLGSFTLSGNFHQGWNPVTVDAPGLPVGLYYLACAGTDGLPQRDGGLAKLWVLR